MNLENLQVNEALLPSTYLKQAKDSLKTRDNLIQHLLQHKKIPQTGWNDTTIEYFLLQLSSMDSNNFPSNSGVGEREGRIASSLVAKRHYYFSHGIGRSGDLTEAQPKAAGSSLIYKLTNNMLEDLFKMMGMQEYIECILVPVATGMSIVLSLLSFKSVKPNTRYVIWSRIDQKSCFKSIISAGFIPIIIDTVTTKDGLVTNISEIEAKIQEIGSDNICCLISTTSCFAPRKCDNIESLAQICKKYNIPHLINNAYGLQSQYLMKRIQKAHRKGRVDVIIQSTDKNIMVPVGGAIIASFDKAILNNIAKTYPGRASSSNVLDVFITLLSLGKEGYLKLVEDRIDLYDYLEKMLKEFATSVNEKVISSLENPISIAITLSNLSTEKLTMLGSMLFLRCISGCRVVTATDEKIIDNYEFKNWGTHTNATSVPYLTAAASIGITKNDVDEFIKKLEKSYNKCVL